MAKNGNRKAKARATAAYFEERYGQEGPTLLAWQMFSRDVGVSEGQSITQCKKNLQSVYVNIIDFVHAISNGQMVYRFASRKALADYIKADWRKRFPLIEAKKGSFLRQLLIHLY